MLKLFEINLPFSRRIEGSIETHSPTFGFMVGFGREHGFTSVSVDAHLILMGLSVEFKRIEE